MFFVSSVSIVTGIKERPTKKQKVVNQGDFSEPPRWEEEMDKFIAETDNEDFEASQRECQTEMVVLSVIEKTGYTQH